ncbi:MAG: efflux RND transporter periplasmic adaptor subunit [bacterium]
MSISDIILKIKSFSKLTWLYIIGGLIIFFIIINVIVISSPNVAYTEVQRDDFVVDLLVKGEINALNSTNISVPRMRRRFSLQIVDMVEEGTVVKKGDFLLQLDNSDATQKVDEAEDQLESAIAQLESKKATIRSNMAQLKSQLQNQRYSYEQAELNLKMMQYEAESRRQEAKLNMKKALVTLEQAKKKIESQKVIDNAELKSAQLDVRQARVELTEAKNNLEKLKIISPTDGMVVYLETWTGSAMRKVQIGDTPFPGMPVMSIPDLSTMKADVTVNERDINKIKKGLNAVITVDALEGMNFYGQLSRVATLAKRDDATNAKVFEVEVRIDSSKGKLRPGMTCNCRIIVNRIEDAFFVPLQSVFQKEGKTIIYVMEGTRPKEREVSTGIKSSDYVVITEGLKEGEKVCLRDPTIPLREIGSEAISTETDKKPKKSSGSVRRVIIH